MTRRAIVTKAAIKRAIHAAQEAGLTVTGYRVEGGTIEVMTGEDKLKLRLAERPYARLY